jgi:hypothetical protein
LGADAKKSPGDSSFVVAYRYGDVTAAARSDSLLKTSAPRGPVALIDEEAGRRDPRWTRPLPWAGLLGDLNSPEEARRALLSIASMAMFAVALILLPGWYLSTLVRRRVWSLKALFVAPVLVGLALVALSAPTPIHVESLPLLQKMAMGFFMLPPVLLLVSLVRWSFQRRWRRIAAWTMVVVLVSGAIAALMIAVHWAGSEGSIPYSWEGWPLVCLLGWYFTGLLLIPAAASEWATRRIQRHRLGGQVR